ncbi:hypothetical protein BJ165DRAFT_1595235 [Panaeolus papilionaceus]|nr:hypothetical protein BJ165DRAFT_1595235 [Panaeolus papilionaceus]
MSAVRSRFPCAAIQSKMNMTYPTPTNLITPHTTLHFHQTRPLSRHIKAMTQPATSPHTAPQHSHHTFIVARLEQNLPIEKFFCRYEKDGNAPFTYSPSESAPINFRRLCVARGCSSDSDDIATWRRYRRLKKKYNRALVDQFNELYGKEDNIAGWQEICRITGTADPPNEIEECKAIMQETQVNLIDLTEWVGDASTTHVMIFETVEDLATYTFESDKVFPGGVIHAGDVLKFFLRLLSQANRSGIGYTGRARRALNRAEVKSGDPQPVTVSSRCYEGRDSLFPVEAFFRQYEKKPNISFFYDPRASAPNNFKRLWKARGFPEDDDKRQNIFQFREMKREYHAALVDQFNQIYGMKDNIEGWQKLCYTTGNTTPPSEITECKEIMRKTHVNLVDLTEWIVRRRTSESQFVTVFENVEQLSEYTITNGKVFPRDHLRAGDILTFFLREIYKNFRPPTLHAGFRMGEAQRQGRMNVRGWARSGR